MPKLVGRDILVKVGAVVIPGLLSKSLSCSKGIIDLTTRDDELQRDIAGGVKQWSVEASGQVTDENYSLLYGAYNSENPVSITFTVGTDAKTGSAIIESIDFTGEDNEATDYSVTFQGKGKLN